MHRVLSERCFVLYKMRTNNTAWWHCPCCAAARDTSTFLYIFMQGREKSETERCHTHFPAAAAVAASLWRTDVSTPFLA